MPGSVARCTASPCAATDPTASVQAAAPADPCASAEAHWKAADAIATTAAYEDHIARFSKCAFANLAKARIDGLKKTALAPSADTRTAGAANYDGKWDVTVNCPASGKVQGYTRPLTATVTNGVIHAEDPEPGKPNWLKIDGQIDKGPDLGCGAAAFGVDDVYGQGRVLKSVQQHF